MTLCCDFLCSQYVSSIQPSSPASSLLPPPSHYQDYHLLHYYVSDKAFDVSGVAEDLMLMMRENQALTSELLMVEDKMS